MKLSIALLYLPLLGSGSASAQVATIPCPASGSSLVIPGVTTSSSLTVRIPVISNAAGLCTIVRRDAADGSKRAPLARSYAGRQWEVSAGKFTSRTPAGATSSSTGFAVVDCSAGDEFECDITLPALENSGQEYVLESFTRTVSTQAEAARFLEQVTFGPTLEDINALVATSNEFDAWAYKQMYELPVSSLRQFYRKRVNPKNDVGYAAGTTSSRPCELFSRWRKYAITSKDTLKNRKTGIFKILQVDYVQGVGYVWKVDNQFRTVTQEKPAMLSYQKIDGSTEWKFQPDPKWSFGLGQKYRIRYYDWMVNCVGCPVPIHQPAPASAGPYWAVNNPEVSVQGVEGTNILPYDIVNLPAFKSQDFPVIDNPDAYNPVFEEWMGYDEHAILNTTSLEESNQCNGFPDFRKSDILNPDHGSGKVWKVKPTVFGRTVDGHTFAYDPHLALPANTVENPIPDGGGQLAIDSDGLSGFSNYNGMYDGTQVVCQNSVKTYLNEDHCKLSYLPSACAPETKPNRVIVLNEQNLAGMRTLTGKKVYAIEGLPLLDTHNIVSGYNAPCGATTYTDQTSRWVKDDNDQACISNLGSVTAKIFRDIIDARDRNLNPNIVDATRSKRTCDDVDTDKLDLGKIKASDGSCWRHSHHQEKDVFDFSSFSSLDQYISGVSTVSMPLATFESISTKVILGRLDEHVIIDDKAPQLLQDGDVQNAYKTVEYNPAQTPVLVCGSVDEVGSDPTLGDHGFEHVEPEGTGYRSKPIHHISAQRHTVWAYHAMNAEDQLRMRTAWALSQIVAVGLPGSGMTFFEPTEDRLVFYDHFVNHAFGIYRDLMKDFSYSLIMANWLSYKENKSLHYNLYWSDDKVANFPDENYAREIMQLFSIGLYTLNMDGSHVLLPNGKYEESYTIEDIMSYSRAWTGFVRPKDRGGVSAGGRQWSDTPMDPMPIDVQLRDVFPKSDLMNGFIGDRVPLCADLPPKHFLRKGATYKLIGSSVTPELHNDRVEWEKNPELLHLEAGSSSPLFVALCAADSNGVCTFPSKVVLGENLVYDLEAQNGDEYKVDTIRSIKLQSGLTHPIHYEYVRQPCVEHAFYNDAMKVGKGNVNARKEGANVIEGSMCADPRLPAATPMCTSPNWSTSISWGMIFCHYHAERVSFASAQEICEDAGVLLGQPLVQGQPGAISERKGGPCAFGVGNSIPYFRWWTSVTCDILVKVDPRTGHVALVHEPQPDKADLAIVEPLVDKHSMNFFKVPWTNDVFPSVEECEQNSCSIYLDEQNNKSCICRTDVNESQVYFSTESITSIENIMNTLHIGAVDPDTYDTGSYSVINCGITDVTVYSTDGDCSSLGIDTIFGFVWKSKQYFLKNSKSVVTIRGSSGFSFRNPVHFINFADTNAYAAHHETDAVLDSLFYHPSHPPFLAIRMIQRFGVSNPSPSFIERVSTAYSTGSYGQFGSGKYGDMGALVAAIILDDESRQVVLDADQSHGHLREPLIKLISFFRSMGLSFNQPLFLPSLIGQQSMIGQGSFESPSVFSFFLPEFSPTGVAQTAGLFLPESMVLSGSKILWLLDGMFSTIKFGLVNNSPKCQQMMAYITFSNYGQKLIECPDEEGQTSNSPAHATYMPSTTASVDAMLDEMSLLLTSGRLSSQNRQLIQPIVEEAYNGGDVAKAVRIAQQLIFSSPEFHSTNIQRKQNTARETAGYSHLPSQQPYKAVVVLMMVGGADSFNLLVPTCADAYKEYKDVRQKHALPTSSLKPITTTDQQCSQFGVNSYMSTVADLYNQNEALFFANTGVLTKKMSNQDDYIAESRFQLYAHNSMQHEYMTGDPLEKNAGTGVFGRLLDILDQSGYHTSANAVDGYGDKMLTGDQLYNNPVNTVGTSPPKSLNLSPTIDNLYDVVKELNGKGEQENSFLGETWSSRVSTALFENEQMISIANDERFEVTGYPITTSEDEVLSSRFKAVAEYMKSREHRNVTRDVFVLAHTGYDLHSANALFELFTGANDALGAFITEVKKQELWDNTVIIMGSDFGRTLNANSNGGTDHAWGGNYFMLGGKVRGGRILGKYPRPLSASNPSWIGRGRMIPTTPWDAVWNGIANWMGVYKDADLNFILPNRYNFNKCDDLFYDTDLFTEGFCDCNSCSGAPASTRNPTSQPTQHPTNPPTTPQTPAPTKQGDTSPPTMQPVVPQPSPNPTPTPTNQPTNHPTSLPTKQPITVAPTTSVPTTAPTIDTHCEGNLLDNGNFEDPNMGDWRGWGSSITLTDGVTGHAIVGSDRSSFRSGPRQDLNEKDLSCLPVGTTFYISFKAKLIDQATGVGVGCDPLDITSCPMITLRHAEWDYISDPNMQWDPNGWNSFHGEYEVTSEWSTSVYIMISGGQAGTSVVADDISMTVVQSASEPTPPPTVVQTLPPTDAPITSVSVGSLVNNVIDEESTVSSFGCSDLKDNVIRRAFDASTEKFICTKTPGAHEHGIIVTPSQSSIINSLRVYAHNNCPTCDAVTFRVEGRVDASNAWVAIGSGHLPWIDAAPVRNSRWLDISSSYESGDTSLEFTEVLFPNNNQTFSDYKLSFDATRDPEAAYLQFSEVELPGELIGAYTSPPTAATQQPTGNPTALPTSIPTPAPSAAISTPAPSTATNVLGDFVNTIFDSDSTVVDVGCVSQSANLNRQAIDRTTEKFTCTKSGTENPGIIVSPSHGQMSIAKKLRVYAHNNCPNCDAVSYVVEGRPDASTGWTLIGEGDLPWRSAYQGSNARGMVVSSTYEDGDSNLEFTEVTFSSNDVAYLEYRLTFPETRDPNSYLQFSEVDLPGFLIARDPTVSPSVSPVEAPPLNGTPVNNIFDTASVGVTVGCTSAYDNTKSKVFDQTTSKFLCFKSPPLFPGIIVTPGSGQMSSAKKLRVYAHNNCPNCDAVSYIVHGRVDSTSDWVLIGNGDLPWKDAAPSRQSQGLPISSTYESGDDTREFTEVSFTSNSERYLEYMIQFPETRDPNSYLQLGEVELVGFLF